MEIKARRWLAIAYQCPQCGAQTAAPRLTPTRKHRDHQPECHNWKHGNVPMEITERKYYTTFVIEASLSGTTTAGTLASIGTWPFKVCDIVHPNIIAFTKWYTARRAEADEQARIYFEQFRQQQEAAAARLQREEKQRALLKEAEQIAYRREHAVEPLAEQIVSAAWVEPDVPNNKQSFDSEAHWLVESSDEDLPDHPF